MQVINFHSALGQLAMTRWAEKTPAREIKILQITRRGTPPSEF